MTHPEQRLDHPAVGASPRTAVPPAPLMMRPSRYALRMVAFLAVIAFVVVALHAHAVQFFLRNPPLNTLILSVLAVGIVQSFRAVLSLGREVAWIDRYQRDDPRLPGEAGPPLLGPLASLLNEPRRRSRLTASSLRSVLDGVDTRLDERRDTSRYLIGLLIFLGLLGTFWGLLMTATSVGETIRGLNVVGTDPAQMFETLRAGLEAPLSGMGTAFSTSLFGLASSLVLGFLDLQAAQAQNRFGNELETWLTGLARVEGDIVEDRGTPAPSYVTALLQQSAEDLGELARRMALVVDDNASLRATLRALVDELRAKNSLTGPAVEMRLETQAVLERIDAGIGRLVEDGARERERAVADIRSEIHLLARTLAVIADRGR